MSSGNGHNTDSGTGKSPYPGKPALQEAADILNKAKSIGYSEIEAKDLPDKYKEEFSPIPLSIDSLTDLMLKLEMKVFQGQVSNEENQENNGDTNNTDNNGNTGDNSSGSSSNNSRSSSSSSSSNNSSGNSFGNSTSNMANCVANDVLQDNALMNNLNKIGQTVDVMQSVKDMASKYINIDTPEGQKVIQQAYSQVANNQNISIGYSTYNQGLNNIVDKLQNISFISFDGTNDFIEENEQKRGIVKSDAEIRGNYSRYVSSVRSKELQSDPEAIITSASKDYQVATTAKSMANISNSYQQALVELISDLQRASQQSSSNKSNKVSAINNANSKIGVASTQYNGRYKAAFSQSRMDVSDLPEGWRP